MASKTKASDSPWMAEAIQRASDIVGKEFTCDDMDDGKKITMTKEGMAALMLAGLDFYHQQMQGNEHKEDEFMRLLQEQCVRFAQIIAKRSI